MVVLPASSSERLNPCDTVVLGVHTKVEQYDAVLWFVKWIFPLILPL